MVEDDTITIGGDVIARWSDHKWWWGAQGFDRAAVSILRRSIVVEFADDVDDRIIQAVLNTAVLSNGQITVETTGGETKEATLLRYLGDSALRVVEGGVDKVVNIRTVVIH